MATTIPAPAHNSVPAPAPPAQPTLISDEAATDATRWQVASLDALPAHIAIIDPAGIIVTVNRLWRQFLTKNKPEEPQYGVGRNYLEVFRSVLGHSMEEARTVGLGIDEVLSGKTAEFTAECRCEIGTESQWFRLTVTPLHTEHIKGAVMMHVNVTEQKRAETEIARTAELLRAVADGTPDAVFVKDRQGRYLLFNEAAARFVGRSAAEVLGQDDTAIFNAADARLIMDSDRQVMESGQASTTEEVLTAASATRIYLATKAPYFDSQGNVVGLIGISRDITERKQAEATLHASLKKTADLGERVAEQAALIDNAQDAILVSDLEHRILYWNKSAERLYGWTAEEALGQAIHDHLSRDSQSLLAATEATITNGEWVGEIEQWTKNGQMKVVEGHWTLMRDKQGQPKSILAINTDLTERKKLERQFLRAQRMESIGTLAGGIAHDLNNVLAPIMLSIDLLKLRENDPTRMNILTTIEKSAKRGAEMVQQVLSFGRGMEVQQVKVHVTHLINEIEKIINDTFLKNIQVVTVMPENLWLIQGDPTQIHQVLMNLCVNARDAMPDGGRLTLSVSNVLLDTEFASHNIDAQPGPYVLIEVEDSGMGMTAEVIERVFEPFFTTKELGKGTGLGLSTTQAIVKSHGGFIRAHSEVGSGTKFCIYLPAEKGSRSSSPLIIEKLKPRGCGELVLVIDDEQAVRDITRHTLEAFGYRVLLATDGADGVDLYARRKDKIAVVLTDMMMPVMDGPATIQVLKRMNPKVRIIAASGINAGGMIAKAASAGAKYFLPKPYTADALLLMLKRVLEAESETEVAPRT